MRYLTLFLLLVCPVLAAEPPTLDENLRLLRQQAAEAEENARRVVREHESGMKPASVAELTAARATIREAEARRAEEAARLKAVAAEVQRRRLLREQATKGEENARRVVREHESGVKPAAEGELAAARTVIREAEEWRAKAEERKVKLATGSTAEKATAKAGGFSLTLPDCDMQTVATAWRTLFGGTPTIAERAKSRIVTARLAAASREEMKVKLVDALRQNGIHVIERADGVIFDTEPENPGRK
jgi:hypothetical protein